MRTPPLGAKEAPRADSSTRAAFEAVLPEIAALPKARVTCINIDPWKAAKTVIALLPQLRLLRTHIAKELPGFDLDRFDKLDQYALAFVHAHRLYEEAGAGTSPLPRRASELATIRDQLLLAAKLLVDHGLLAASRIQSCKKSIGYRALLQDVAHLVGVYRKSWAAIENKTPITAAKLDDAAQRAAEISRLLGARDRHSDDRAAAARSRDRAFTLFVRAYDDARHAVEYLRREQGDAGVIAPSLYKGRGGRRRGAS
jgi:hypothetical protein